MNPVTMHAMRRPRLVAAALASTSLLALAPEAMAAAADEIVITARKRAERLVDVPIAASVISGEELLQRGGLQLDLGDIVQGVPGTRFNNLTGNSLSEVNLRGSGAARGTNAEVAVGLFRDGVYAAGGFQFARNIQRIDTFDLERAEVLRGTQGALFGRNAVGGAINLISAKPQFERSGRASIDRAWDIEAWDLQAVVNEPINDKLAVRVSAEYWDQDGGFIFSPVTKINNSEGAGVLGRAQLRYKADRIDITALIERQELEDGSVYAATMIMAGTAGPFSAGYNPGHYAIPTNFKTPKNVQNLNNFTLTGNFDLGFATLTSVSGFRDRHTSLWIDLDLLSVEAVLEAAAQGNPAVPFDPILAPMGVDTFRARILTDDTQTLYQELHLAGRSLDRLDWLVGAELLDQHGFYNTNDTQSPMAGVTSSRGNTDFDYFSVSPYGSIGIDFTDKLTIEAEVRYTHDNKRAWQYRWSAPTMSKPAVPNFKGTLEANNVSFNSTVSYDVTPQAIVFAKVGTGYRSGGFNPNLGNPAAPRPVVPAYGNERSTTYEFGAKGNIFDDLFAGLAVYHTHVSNAITRTDNGCFVGSPICSEQPTNYALNAGRANLWGVELESSLRFALLGGNGVLRASGSRQEGEYAGGALDGFEVPQNPDWIAGANLNYRRPFIGPTEIFGNVNYTGSWGGVQETEGVPELSSYNLVDARLGVGWEGWEASLYAKNATNTNFVLLGTATSQRWSLRRVWGATLRYRW